MRAGSTELEPARALAPRAVRAGDLKAAAGRAFVRDNRGSEAATMPAPCATRSPRGESSDAMPPWERPRGSRSVKIGDMDYDKVLALFRALGAHEVEYVVVGAVALGLHGFVRATGDVDLFIRPSVENVDRLRSAPTSVWPDPAIGEIDAAGFAGEFGVVSYVPPAGELSVDLIARLEDALSFDDIEWRELDAGGGVVARVATPRMLYDMKRGTLRPQDAADAHVLREKFNLEDA